MGKSCNKGKTNGMYKVHRFGLENYRLETSAKHYGIDINAHDSMSDIEATRELILEIIKEIK